MILAIIIACEIGFWVLIVLGLSARYLLRWKRLGIVLLALTPLVDLILLAATAIDLRNGTTATFVHGLAALYLGFSVAYGHTMISWADVRFAHRFAGGPAPIKRFGSEYAKECWKDLVRTAVAVAISAGVLWLLIALVNDDTRTDALSGIYQILAIILGAELIWAIGYTIWPKKHPVESTTLVPD